MAGPEVITDVGVAARALRDGKLVAFPTETVYGLGALATDDAALRRVFVVKGRPPTHPLIVHLADASLLDEWAASVSPTARALAEAFWPGPLTLLVARSAIVSDLVTGGRDTVGLRVPDHPVAAALLAAVGSGVAAPSANRFGRVSPTTAAHVVDDLGADVDVVLDGGPCPVGVESTIVDCSGDAPVVLRPGGVTVERLGEVLGAPVKVWAGEGPSVAPGMLASHYAPRAEVVVVEQAADLVDAVEGAHGLVGVLGPNALGPHEWQTLEAALAEHGELVELEPAGDPERYARVLYDRLRQADRLGVSRLVVVAPAPIGVGVAVRDRLGRAGRYQPR